MASIGVEYVDSFANVRASGKFDADDLDTPPNICSGFVAVMTATGFDLRFYRTNQDVNERHMREFTKQGDDQLFADRVDLYFIATHGNYRDKQVQLLLDVEQDSFLAESKDWRFGNNCNLEWLMIYGCHSIDSEHILDHLGVFRGLHLFCGAYGFMYDSWTLDEVGWDVAAGLSLHKTVSDAWCEGATDWFIENHPMVISVETEETYNGGHPKWSETVIRSDHFWGRGTTRSDIPPNKQFWMSAVWSDAGFWDYG